MTVRILQFGTTGQVGRELLAQAARHEVEIAALSRAEADFTQPERTAQRVAQHRPDLVVIAAAYTAVDRAEAEPELASQVNAGTPAAIARACRAHGAALVNFSTDYVFDGEKGAPYVEDDAPNPLNAYGRSKLEGERLVLSACPRSTTLRTSWVVSSHGRNFVTTMLRLAREGQPIRVVDDQYGRPTAAADLAGFVLGQAARLAGAGAGDPVFGLHHFANADEESWRSFAEGVFELAMGPEAPPVEAIATADRPAPARRPARGTLDTARLERTFGVAPRPWREPLAQVVAELSGQGAPAA